MIFTPTSLTGAFVIELEKRIDDRGFFARSFCADEFSHQGLEVKVVQCNISFNKTRGTLRGMHFQQAPYSEVRLVRCTRGAIHDVIIDLRRNSSTFKQSFSIELNSDNGKMVYVPQGCAHGFLTLTDNTEVFYQMSEFYHPESSSGVRYNDPAFGIVWPEEVKVISEKDMQFRDFSVWSAS